MSELNSAPCMTYSLSHQSADLDDRMLVTGFRRYSGLTFVRAVILNMRVVSPLKHDLVINHKIVGVVEATISEFWRST